MTEDATEQLQFLSELKLALKNYGDVDDEMVLLKIKKDDIKNNIKSWAKMHNIIEYETLDITEKALWRLQFIKSIRREVDHDYLETILTPTQLEFVYKKTEIESFKCGKVKTRKNQSTKKPLVPEGFINV
jgi:hypothetical protein